ncbi:MAG: hypothetical protein ACOYD0_04425 [Candidatus Nanopelagicales bacterium]
MPNLDDMLEAHVQFELKQWHGRNAQRSLNDEVHSVYDWLADVPIRDLVNEAGFNETLLGYLCDAPIDRIVRTIAVGVAHTIHRVALTDDTRLDGLISKTQFDALASAALELEQVRTEVVEQVTTSGVYSQLIAHVLYQGIKNYLQTENVIAKRVPGASKLMRLSQQAVNSAAPKLEQSIDRQLTAFVGANIQDTIRESRQYLNSALDETVLGAVADEVWSSNKAVTVEQLAALVPSESVNDLVDSVVTIAMSIRSTPSFRALLKVVVGDLLTEHGDSTVGSLLDDLGLDQAATSKIMFDVLTPVMRRAYDDGYLEQRIRARLAPFYMSYGRQKTAKKSVKL